MVTLCLTFWGIAKLVSKAGIPFCISTSKVWGFQFLHICTNPHYCLFILPILVDVKWYLLWFDLHFPNEQWSWTPFMCWLAFWILIGRTAAEASILWPLDAKSQLIAEDPDVEKDWRQEEELAEDEMVGWHHWFNGHEFEQTPKDRGTWHAAVHGIAKSWTWLTKTTTRLSFLSRTPGKTVHLVWDLTPAYKHKLETAINTSSSAFLLLGTTAWQ